MDMRQTEFAERIGIGQNYLSTMERGNVEIGGILLRISREFVKSVEWLLTGEGRIMIPPAYKLKAKFMQACDRGGKARSRPRSLCHRCRHHAAHWESGSGYRICRQPCKNLGFVHQAPGASNKLSSDRNIREEL